MPAPRSTIVDEAVTPWYHCISRCVRRAFLCGQGCVRIIGVGPFFDENRTVTNNPGNGEGGMAEDKCQMTNGR